MVYTLYRRHRVHSGDIVYTLFITKEWATFLLIRYLILFQKGHPQAQPFYSYRQKYPKS